jgi:hypothetical protein
MPRISGAFRNLPFDDGYTKAFDYSGNNILYYGRAKPGSLKSAAAWSIQFYTYSGNNITDIQYAGGKDTFTNVWDDRASLSYS